MKTKGKAGGGGKKKMEMPQGKIGKSGVNTPIKKEKVPQKKVENTYGKPTQTQKL